MRIMERVPASMCGLCCHILLSCVLLLLCSEICNGQTGTEPIKLGAAPQFRGTRLRARESISVINASPRTQVKPVNSAAVRSLTSRTWQLAFCSFPLSFRGKQLNRNNFRFTTLDATSFASLLNGEEVLDKTYVWCRTAHFNILAEQKLGRRITGAQSVEQLNVFQGDIIVSLENVDELFSPVQNAFLLSNRRAIPQLSSPRSFQVNNRPVIGLTNRGISSVRRPTASRGGFFTPRRSKRKIVSSSFSTWVDEPAVDYIFMPSLTPKAEAAVKLGLEQWSQWTCIKFNKVDTVTGGFQLKFESLDGCWSFVGKQSGGQTISIGSGCEWGGIAAHEIGHALGFFHEQSRPDRDDYVRVNPGNIQPGLAGNFEKLEWRVLKTSGVPYDYGSVMHYGPKEFAVGETRTIDPLDELLDSTMGQREGLSFADIKLANLHYCSNTCTQGPLEWSACKHDGYRNPKECTTCICPKGFSPPFCDSPDTGRNADCGNTELTATAAYQTLASDGHNTQGGFKPNAYCAWKITAPDGQRVVFEFQDKFEFEDGFLGLTCDLSYVEVRRDPRKPGKRFCNKQRPSTIMTSAGSAMTVIMVGGSDGGLAGFKARYKTERCGGCSAGAGNSEPACTRIVHTEEEYKVDDTCSGSACVKRKNLEFTEETFCCSGYVLSRNRCVGSQTTPTTRRTTPSTRRTTPSTTRTTPSTRRTTPSTRRTTPSTRRTTPSTRRTTPSTRRTTPSTRRTTPSTIRTTPSTRRTTPSTTGPVTPGPDGYGPFGPWTGCSVTCGYCGFQTRSRRCLRHPCQGLPWEVKRCPPIACPYYPFVAAACYWTTSGEIWCLPQGSFCFHKVNPATRFSSAGKDGNPQASDGTQIVGTLDLATGTTTTFSANSGNTGRGRRFQPFGTAGRP